MDLQALRSQSINKIREQFDELSGEQLTQLRAMESAEEAPRATLVKAIDDKLEELGATAPASDTEPLTASQVGLSPAATQDTPPPKPPGADDTAAAPAVEAPAAPAWQAPDYCGPLTGDQAMWRVANLKAR